MVSVVVVVVVGKYGDRLLSNHFTLKMETVNFLEYSVFQPIRKPCQYLIKSRYENVGPYEVLIS